MILITISRQLGSLGDEIADALSRKTGWKIITKDYLLTHILPDVSTPHELHMISESPKFYLKEMSEGMTFIQYIKNQILKIAKNRPLILLGFGSQYIFKNYENIIRVRIISPWDVRIDRMKRQYNISATEAETILKLSDRKKRRFVATVFGESEISDHTGYDITINTVAFSTEEYVSVIVALIKERETRIELHEQQQETDAINNKTRMTSFKNPEETEFASILDMYNIEWIYEPKTFPIEWDTDGNITQAFSPDFYLPGLDQYIELTIMNQKYVTQKNKKAKKLQELYPGINISIVYKKDFQSLIKRLAELGA